MNNNSHRPYEWAAVFSWSLSLFLLGLTTARTPFGSEMDRLALGLFSGIVWAVVGGLIVALWKYFKRSPAAGKAGHLDVTQNQDRALFIVAMVIAVFLVGKGLYLETYGSFIDAAILTALGFGVRAGLHFARWLFAIYAFVTPILVIGHGGGNAVIWPFVFFYACRSIIVQGGSQLTEDTYGLRDQSPVLQVASGTSVANEGEPQRSARQYESSLPVDEDIVYGQIAAELDAGKTDKALWTRLFAECGGDEKQTTVQYIRYRAERMIAVERARLNKPLSDSEVLVDALTMHGFHVEKRHACDYQYRVVEVRDCSVQVYQLKDDNELSDFAKRAGIVPQSSR